MAAVAKLILERSAAAVAKLAAVAPVDIDSEASVQSLFDDTTDDEDVIDLDEVDAVAQKARAETKVQMAAKKAQAAEDAAAKTKAEAQKKADRAKVRAETIKKLGAPDEPPALKG